MPNSYDLIGKTALVTGGAKGIGRAIVAHLAASGAKVRVWDLNPVEIDGVATDVVDVTQAPQIAAALSRFADRSNVDILVNDAGYLGRHRHTLVTVLRSGSAFSPRTSSELCRSRRPCSRT